MPSVDHPELLAAEYVPPTLIGRAVAIERVRRWLTIPSNASGSLAVARVVGPAGSGTSAVARVSARRSLEDLRHLGCSPEPVLATVRVRGCRGTQGVAAALLRTLDDGFNPRGFHTTEMIAGFLRRLVRDGRAAVIALDDIGPAAPDLSPVLAALRHPERFLPEGVGDPPAVRLVVAGRPEASAAWSQWERCDLPMDPLVELAPYTPEEIRAIVRDRALRSTGRPLLGSTEDRLVRQAASGPGGADRALQLLRRELLGHDAVVSASVRPGLDRTLQIEPHFLAALSRALERASAPLGEVRSWEARLARSTGRRPLPPTTLWRRILRLEEEGLVRRTIRPGGCGGTRSVLELLRPFSEWPIPPARPGTLRADDVFANSGPSPRAATPEVRWTPAPRPS